MQPFEYLIDKELIDALRKRFPLVVPQLDWPDRRVWFEAGQQMLIQFLEDQWREQNDDILSRSILKEK